MRRNQNINFIFYLYYVLVLVITLADVFFLHKTSSTIFFGLASAFIGIIIQMFYNDYKKQRADIVASVENIPKIELLHEEEFYAKFGYYIHNARKNVDLAHLALESPFLEKKPEQSDYYNNLVDLVKSNTSVTFRRVERISKDKINWIQHLIKGFENQDNFSLYCFVDDESAKENEMSDLLSIQIIDDKHLFIVALLEHTSTKGHRDIYIRDKDIAGFFRDYYKERLIKRCKPIIQKGTIKKENWKQMKELIK